MRCGNFYKADIKDADVVFVYLSTSQTSKLSEKLEKELRPGARVVSIAADFSDWQPDIFDREALIFVYRIPPGKMIEPAPFANGVQ
jgi:hypothetical protein